jgi:probable rRNA maturation factor
VKEPQPGAMSPIASAESFAVGRTDDAPPFPAEHEVHLARLAGLLAAAHAVPQPVQFILTGDGYIRRLNASFRGLDAATDVLSFDLSAAGDEVGLSAGGEVYVCLDRASVQAAEQQTPLLAEVARLLAHGLLHLAGYEHDSPAALRAMEAETDRLLGLAGLAHRGTAQ